MTSKPGSLSFYHNMYCWGTLCMAEIMCKDAPVWIVVQDVSAALSACSMTRATSSLYSLGTPLSKVSLPAYPCTPLRMLGLLVILLWKCSLKRTILGRYPGIRTV